MSRRSVDGFLRPFAVSCEVRLKNLEGKVRGNRL